MIDEVFKTMNILANLKGIALKIENRISNRMKINSDRRRII